MCMNDGDETSYLLPPFSSYFLCCCGNEKADLRFLSPIVSLKLLNFSAHMTVSQGSVRARKEKAHMQAHPCSQEHTPTSGHTPLYTKHTLTGFWEKSAIYFVSWPQCSLLFLDWLKECWREKKDEGWKRTMERALEKAITFFCLVCVR